MEVGKKCEYIEEKMFNKFLHVRFDLSKNGLVTDKTAAYSLEVGFSWK